MTAQEKISRDPSLYFIRIILHPRRWDMKREMSMIHPPSGRHVRTDHFIGPSQDDIDREVMKLKVNLERNGHRVEVIEQSRP